MDENTPENKESKEHGCDPGLAGSIGIKHGIAPTNLSEIIDNLILMRILLKESAIRKYKEKRKKFFDAIREMETQIDL